MSVVCEYCSNQTNYYSSNIDSFTGEKFDILPITQKIIMEMMEKNLIFYLNLLYHLAVIIDHYIAIDCLIEMTLNYSM